MSDDNGHADEKVGGRTIAFEDAALVASTQKGDMQAFGSLVAKYQDRTYNLMYHMCCNPEDAEELAQEAFLKALEKISQFRGQSKFYTWLFRIAANLAISNRRRGGKIRFQSLSADADTGLSQAAALTARNSPTPQAAVLAGETQVRIAQALEALDDEMRTVVLLRDVEDMSYSDIAEVISVPIGTVKSRLYRARETLKEKLMDLVG